MPVTTGQLDIEDDYDVQYKSLRRLHPEFDFQTEKQARKILFYGKNKSGRLYKIASVYDRQHSEVNAFVFPQSSPDEISFVLCPYCLPTRRNNLKII